MTDYSLMLQIELRKTPGFSLIELLVVIAIVGVLAAIATPVYQRYVVSARLNAAAVIFQNNVQKSIEYAQIHGVFPNAAQLGMSSSPYPTRVDPSIAEAMIPYFNPASNYWNIVDFSACGGRGSSQIYLDPAKLGMSFSPGNVVQNGNGAVLFEAYYAHYNGVYYVNFQYHSCLYNGSGYPCTTEKLLPAPWVNAGNAYNIVVPSSTTFQNAYNNFECS